MKTTLRLRPHTLLPDTQVIEVWYGDQFIAEVTGADGPGVRVLSKYSLHPEAVDPGRATPIAILHVRIGPQAWS
jgi:hypothetical protein